MSPRSCMSMNEWTPGAGVAQLSQRIGSVAAEHHHPAYRDHAMPLGERLRDRCRPVDREIGPDHADRPVRERNRREVCAYTIGRGADRARRSSVERCASATRLPATRAPARAGRFEQRASRVERDELRLGIARARGAGSMAQPRTRVEHPRRLVADEREPLRHAALDFARQHIVGWVASAPSGRSHGARRQRSMRNALGESGAISRSGEAIGGGMIRDRSSAALV